MRTPRYRLIQCLLLVVLASSVLAAQGTLRGIVRDSLTNEPLIGCNVFVVGTSLGASTSIDGDYRIVGIPQGSYTIRVSYVGFNTQFIPLRMEQEDMVLDAKVGQAMINSEEVVVIGQLKGQMAAINQQISSKTIVNVVSEEKIKELPDANAAEAIGRLPGVSLIRSGGEASKVVLRGLSSKYSNITVDGAKIPPTDLNSRDVDLSMISQGTLAGVELFKAITSDMDADAIAGSVNLVTKKAPAERVVRVTSRGGYNAVMNSAKQYDLQLQYGERFFDDLLGVQVTGNIEQKIRSNERTDIDYTQFDPDSASRIFKNYEINNFKLQFIDEERKRDGVGLLLDFNTPDGGVIKFNNVLNKTNRDYLTAQRNYPLASDLTYSAQHIKEDISTINSSVHGTNFLFGFEMNWGASFAQSRTETPYDFYLDFLEPSSSTSGLKPGLDGIKDHPEQLIAFGWNNYVAATCSSGYDRSRDALDKERTIKVDLEQKFTLDSFLSGSVKGGGKYRDKARTMSGRQLYAPYYLGYWKEMNADGSTKALLGTRFERFYNDFLATGFRLALADDFIDHPLAASHRLFSTYTMEPLIDRATVDLWHDLNIHGYNPSGGSLASEYYADPLTKVNNYGVDERVSAGYLMGTVNVGEFVTVIGGVRVEAERDDYRSSFIQGEATGFPVSGTTKDTSAAFNETIWLPNIHIATRPFDFLTVRLAAYKALGRPDFNLRLNRYSAARSGASSTLDVGNPTLRSAKAWNYEINASIFGGDIGLISVSVFYKKIDDIVHQLNGLSVSGDSLYKSFGIGWNLPSTFSGGSYRLTAPYNSLHPTTIWGLELEHQANFTFLPGFFQHFILNYNISISRSETYLITSSIRTDSSTVIIRGHPSTVYTYTVVTHEGKQRTEGQPELFGNVSLGYDNAGFSVRLSTFYQGDYNNTFSADGQSDAVVNSFTRWDLAIKQEVMKGLTVVCNINNITNIKEQTSVVNRVRDWHLLNTEYTFGRTADFGVRIDF